MAKIAGAILAPLLSQGLGLVPHLLPLVAVPDETMNVVLIFVLLHLL